MAILPGSFIKTNEKYGSGVAIDEYKGEFSLCAAFEGENGQVYIRWSYPQKGKGDDRGPNDKAVPHKISLGNKQQFIQRMEQLIHQAQRG